MPRLISFKIGTLIQLVNGMFPFKNEGPGFHILATSGTSLKRVSRNLKKVDLRYFPIPLVLIYSKDLSRKKSVWAAAH